MKIGLIGWQKAGKSTIFNALTGANIDTSAFASQQTEVHQAVVEVGDERITYFSELYQPKKTIYATIEYLDFSGLQATEGSGELFSAQLQSLVRNTDALALVLRNFEDEVISGMFGAPQPQKDLDALEAELMLTDQILIEKRLEKIELNIKRGVKPPQQAIEEKALKTMLGHLNEEKPLRTIELPEEEDKAIRGFQFLSQKPLLIILNSSEANYLQSGDLIAQWQTKYQVVEFAGRFEMDLQGLEEEEAALFMADMGITSSAKDKLTLASYELLGYISFFTVGPDEVRAWTMRRGGTAVDAAGHIHSDLARGFIRAECFSYQDFVTCGSEKVLREKGLFRVEGKNYIVKDGDVLSIRFNV